MAEEVGVSPCRSRPGEVELPLRADLLNPEGVLQGALVALVCEAAALDLADRDVGVSVLCELDLRYLAGASVGPVHGQATWIGEPEKGRQTIALRDRGRDMRPVATAFARVAGAPTGRGTR